MQLIHSFYQRKDFNGAALGIHNPIFGHAELFIERLFLDAIPLPGLRDDLNNQIGDTADSVLNDFAMRFRNEKQIGLHDAVLGQDDVERTEKNGSQIVLMNKVIEQSKEFRNNCLM